MKTQLIDLVEPGMVGLFTIHAIFPSEPMVRGLLDRKMDNSDLYQDDKGSFIIPPLFL